MRSISPNRSCAQSYSFPTYAETDTCSLQIIFPLKILCQQKLTWKRAIPVSFKEHRTGVPHNLVKTSSLEEKLMGSALCVLRIWDAVGWKVLLRALHGNEWQPFSYGASAQEKFRQVVPGCPEPERGIHLWTQISAHGSNINVCRLRLTLPPEEGSLSQEGKNKTERTKKHLYQVPNGLSTGNFSHGVVYGVVHRSDNNHKKEMVVYGWSTHQLKEEMKYIRDVRLTLERARKKMYGEYDDMKRKIQELTKELTVSSTQQGSLENHLQVHSAALDSFSEMNSSLTSASIELQKTLVDVALENTVIRDQIKNLKETHEQSMEKLKEKQKQLETARVENELLKLKVECSQEANAEVMREMTRKLYSQYEEQLLEEEQKHKLEKETLIAETNKLLKAIEDANKRMRLTETSLQEKDQKIGELDQFIQRMEEERHQLQKQLLEYELQLHGANPHSHAGRQRPHPLEEVTASLRERIKHLDDMVLCQQKKVKHMVEEIELQKRKMKQKEFFIMQLLEKIAFLEGENKELQDRLDYLMETQPKADVETRDVGVGCDLPLSTEQSSRPWVAAPTRNYAPFERVWEYSSRTSTSARSAGPGLPLQ